jgi:hypothetical protein
MTTPPLQSLKEGEQLVASWITEKRHAVEASRMVPSGDTGVEEVRIVRSVKCYIHVGNLAVHGSKRILRLKHRAYRLAGLVSRGIEQAKNIVHVWGDVPA